MANARTCNDTRPCFARGWFDQKTCSILRETYEKDGQCPFCKVLKSDLPATDKNKKSFP